MAKHLLEGLAASAELFSDKPALVSADTETTYADLWQGVISFSAFLQNRIARGDRVAILLENSAEYIEACYGCWACGAVVVGLNTALKGAELSRQLDHCGARWLVTSSSNKSLASIVDNCNSLESMLFVGDAAVKDFPVASYHWNELLECESFDPIHSNSDGELACVIYTSGTTGKPKGVALSHANLAANISSINQYLDIRASDRMMCVLPFFYSYGNSVLHTHLMAGASLLLENQFLYPHKVLERMSEQRATSFAGVPSTYYLLLSRTKLASYDLSSMRYCTQAGGPMKTESIAGFRQALPAVEFIVMFGQTEATARLSYLPSSKLEEKAGSVGIAIPGVELAVVDEQGEVLVPGEVGEVYARGENIMLGYLNDEEATEQVIDKGWLRTGDLGYFDEEGYLFLVGRSREMIKSGAHRIAPREIEELLLDFPGVEDVAVIAAPDDLLGQVVKACVIASDDDSAFKMKIMKYCREHLANYKVPKQLDFYQEFPRTSSGKIQKHLIN